MSGRGARAGRVVAGVALSVFAFTLGGVGGGCVTEGPPPRKPVRPLEEQPTGLVVDQVVPAIDKLANDTDRNGYYDTFRVAFFFFAPGYSQSIESQGVLTCTLTDPATGKVLAKWVKDEQAMREAWGLSGVMPGYNFLLNINDVATDKVECREALFACEFTPKGGVAVPSRSRLVVIVGPLR